MYICMCVYIYVYSSVLLSMHVLVRIFVFIKVTYLIVCLIDISVATSWLGIAIWVVPSILFRNCKVEYNHWHQVFYSGNKIQPT